MKIKHILLSFLFIMISSIFFISCSSSTEQEILPKGKMRFDLSPYGKQISIVLPDSASGKLSISENNTQLEVQCTNQQTKLNFGLSIEETSGTIDLIKNDIAADEINRFKRFLIEDSTLLVWESEIVTSEFHLYAVVSTTESTFVVRDLQSTENEPYNEQQIKEMADAIKSIRLVNKTARQVK
jgi:hypothetical protein